MNKKWHNLASGTEYEGLYKSWYNMFQRAGNKDGRHPSYSDVSVCERWLSYDNFFEDMADTWWKGASLDKDSILPGNKVYCKEYCKWVLKGENSREGINRNGSPMKNPEIVNKFKGENSSSKRPDVRKKMAEKMIGKIGVNSRKHTRVKCVETGVIYECCRDAERELNLKKDSVAHAANPKDLRKTSAGYHFEYA